ncbi:MAG: EAL domain-containing protein [Candidatus Competibacteraceae bacterium]|nr:EAL domain-containing protein [Candidatus Competibacteraceae bacterium]MCP5125990.1 EAL domain-containing protein [Gammaproteobacteria bacterium]HRX70720.1 LapD/MoxY N-terminal periplasmic domain-containing protein [Candidatus Competibacteraceae bacterium]
MSLSRQLLLLISVLFLLIFSGNFIASVNKIRDYLQTEAKVHAQNTATSLGLSLSPHIADPHDPILETMIKAIYDMGYYQEIKLTDIDGNALVLLNDSKIFEQVPRIFIELLPIETATAMSEINSGWNIAGIVYVTSNPGYAYLKLYQQIKNSFYYSFAAFLLSVALLFLVLRFTLQPLKKIDQLAKTIASGRFARIEKLPWTHEVRNVARSMNFMADKIQGVIDNLHQKLETLSHNLLLDELTGLHKKGSLETDMEQLLATQEDGYLFYLKINEFAELARNRGNAATDRLLQAFSATLKECARAQHPTARAYRFYGSEFALLMPGLRAPDVEPAAHALQHQINELGAQYRHTDIVHIGIAPLNPQGSPTGILAAANDAYEQATLIGANSYFIRPSNEQGKSDEEWRDLVFDIIDRQRYQVSYVGPVEDLHSGGIIMEEAFTQARDEADQPIPIGVFVAIAEKFNKIVELDQGVTRKVTEHIIEGSLIHGIIVNLSMTTLKNADFRFWLIDFLRQNALLANQLVFSVTAYAAAKDIELFKNFTDFVRQHGARIMLKRYDAQFISVEALKSLKPDYIRLTRELTVGISTENGKKALVEAIKEVGELLDIFVIAEDVQTKSDFDVVKEIGLPGAIINLRK